MDGTEDNQQVFKTTCYFEELDRKFGTMLDALGTSTYWCRCSEDECFHSGVDACRIQIEHLI